MDSQANSADWNDWQSAPEPEAIEGDWSDAIPVCPRCLHEVGELDHYCGECMFAVGRCTPNIPFVNIPFLCEPFCIMWERLWRPHRETNARRALYATMLVVAGIISGYGWVLIVGLIAQTWWPPHWPGHCPRCGYDLRANHGRCPECGIELARYATDQSLGPSAC